MSQIYDKESERFKKKYPLLSVCMYFCARILVAGHD